MAWLVREKSGIFHVGFRFGGVERKRSLKTRNERLAIAAIHHLEETIRLVQSGRLVLPHDVDVARFLLSDGKLKTTNGNKQDRPVKLGELFQRYHASLPLDAHAPETIRIAVIHMRHFVRILGRRLELHTVSAGDLQRYISKRSHETGKRGNSVSATTIKKELATFRTLWGWARRHGHVFSGFPNDGLKFPPKRQKPPFQTWAQIERQINGHGLTSHQKDDLWT